MPLRIHLDSILATCVLALAVTSCTLPLSDTPPTASPSLPTTVATTVYANIVTDPIEVVFPNTEPPIGGNACIQGHPTAIQFTDKSLQLETKVYSISYKLSKDADLYTLWDEYGHPITNSVWSWQLGTFAFVRAQKIHVIGGYNTSNPVIIYVDKVDYDDPSLAWSIRNNWQSEGTYLSYIKKSTDGTYQIYRALVQANRMETSGAFFQSKVVSPISKIAFGYLDKRSQNSLDEHVNNKNAMDYHNDYNIVIFTDKDGNLFIRSAPFAVAKGGAPAPGGYGPGSLTHRSRSQEWNAKMLSVSPKGTQMVFLGRDNVLRRVEVVIDYSGFGSGPYETTSAIFKDFGQDDNVVALSNIIWTDNERWYAVYRNIKGDSRYWVVDTKNGSTNTNLCTPRIDSMLRPNSSP